jgi:hypothetical protein
LAALLVDFIQLLIEQALAFEILVCIVEIESRTGVFDRVVVIRLNVLFEDEPR